MSSNGPEDDDPPNPRADLFPFDERSTGEASSLRRRANQVTGAQQPPQRPADPALKPMTGAQLAFRPSAPPRATPSGGSAGAQPPLKPGQKPTTGTHTAYKPTTGTHSAFKPASSAPTAPRPSTGVQPAFKPGAPVQGKTGTQQFAAFRPSSPPPAEAPAFEQERLQAQIRARSITDSALGRAAKGAPKAAKLPPTAVEDTFVKTKMKQAESKVVDFDLDEDLG